MPTVRRMVVLPPSESRAARFVHLTEIVAAEQRVRFLGSERPTASRGLVRVWAERERYKRMVSKVGEMTGCSVANVRKWQNSLRKCRKNILPHDTLLHNAHGGKFPVYLFQIRNY